MKKILVNITIEEHETIEGDPIENIVVPSIGIKVKYRDKLMGYPFICSDIEPINSVPELVKECLEVVIKS